MASRKTKQANGKAVTSSKSFPTREKGKQRESRIANNTTSEITKNPHGSQTSSDDGITAALVQKLQSGFEKKKREKETKCLAAYQEGLLDIQTRGRVEFNECCDQCDKLYESFLLDYAKMEDHIRAIWVKIAKTFEPYMDQIREQLDTEEQAEKIREKEQILGVAYHKKADEDFQRLITALMEEVTGKK